MMSRRQLLTWWRRAPAPPPAPIPPPARTVPPVWIDDPEPFSLEAFYRARAEERGR